MRLNSIVLTTMLVFLGNLCLAQAPTKTDGGAPQVKSVEIANPTPVATPADAKKDQAETKDQSAPKKPGKKGFKTMYAIFDTTLGKIKCRLFFDKAPETVANFVDLAEGNKEWKDVANGGVKKKSHFYDGLTFHRIIPKFMIQGGDPMGNGTGGPGYQFKDEVYPDLHFDKPGMLAMANSGPNTNGSQFFITVVPTNWLERRHTIFGEVTEGMDVVNKIVMSPKDNNDAPLKPIKINKVTILRN